MDIVMDVLRRQEVFARILFNIKGRCKRFPRIEVIFAEHPIHSFSDRPFIGGAFGTVRNVPLGILEGIVGCTDVLNAIDPSLGLSWRTEYAKFACRNALTPLLLVSINLLI